MDLVKKDYTEIPNPYKFGRGKLRVERCSRLTSSSSEFALCLTGDASKWARKKDASFYKVPAPK